MAHVQDFAEQVSGAAAQAAVNRLVILARCTLKELGTETAEGGEPSYPSWISDVLLIDQYVRQVGLS
ncbi:hypothetical protein [Achromobacter insolitus]|uniref:hypothetical protein n=1 Tax=Achromobacter insolitus TaxID=217204 RepID=UPI0028AB5B7F|nr:hypothetical protein [Achromobacter insolitus]